MRLKIKECKKRVEIENEEVAEDDADHCYSETNYYSRGSTDEEYDEDEEIENFDKGNAPWDTDYENQCLDMGSKFKNVEDFRLCSK